MRLVYYDAAGQSMDSINASDTDHLLGKVEREMALPIFQSLFTSLYKARVGWGSALKTVEDWSWGKKSNSTPSGEGESERGRGRPKGRSGDLLLKDREWELDDIDGNFSIPEGAEDEKGDKD